ncbi:MAG: 4-hydroxy-3-methylbut-2-en-1-yl diphosphate synthase [Bacteroidales bacterium]
MKSLYNYKRRQSWKVAIGNTPLGEDCPIRLQSMTNTSTLDTEASVAQAIRIIQEGGAYVRLTAQGVREAENLQLIRSAIREAGYETPLVADIHFNPRAADAAALSVEKVRINPGNYVDSARTFKQLEYTEEEYAAELQKIRDRFTPFLNLCKQHNTAIRIGVNHGSLSDRIMSRYGDTPRGMVESCMEFLRICMEEDFHNVVLSVKASNTVVMVKTVRLLVAAMEAENMKFPLHLGVTEAGDGEDGRIKSAVGIGALLSDGIGDTVRVSLSEAPELEIPVARKLVEYITAREGHDPISAPEEPDYNPFDNPRRATVACENIGGTKTPVVIADYSDTEEIPTESGSMIPDYYYIGMREANLFGAYPVIGDADNRTVTPGTPLLYDTRSLEALQEDASPLKFLRLKQDDINLSAPHSTPQACMQAVEILDTLRNDPTIVVIAESDSKNRPGAHRALIFMLDEEEIANPVILSAPYSENDAETLQIKAAADLGVNLIDQLADGIMISNRGTISTAKVSEWMFGILQAARLRTTKTEYISCPGCGRTLFDLQTTIARVRKATAHLTGLKIGIMGCIVNGPGEMADADYGYVGAGRSRISINKQIVCLEKNIPETEAVDKLIELIKANGDWKD